MPMGRPPHDGTAALDRFRHEITHRYITLGQKLRDIMSHLSRQHDLEASEAAYKRKLKDWGVRKNRGPSRNTSSRTTRQQASRKLTRRTPAADADQQDIRNEIHAQLNRASTPSQPLRTSQIFDSIDFSMPLSVPMPADNEVADAMSLFIAPYEAARNNTNTTDIIQNTGYSDYHDYLPRSSEEALVLGLMRDLPSLSESVFPLGEEFIDPRIL